MAESTLEGVSTPQAAPRRIGKRSRAGAGTKAGCPAKPSVAGLHVPRPTQRCRQAGRPPERCAAPDAGYEPRCIIRRRHRFRRDRHHGLHGNALERGPGRASGCLQSGQLCTDWKLYGLESRLYRGWPKDGSIRSVDSPPFLEALIDWYPAARPPRICTGTSAEPPWCRGERYVFLGPRVGTSGVRTTALVPSFGVVGPLALGRTALPRPMGW